MRIPTRSANDAALHTAALYTATPESKRRRFLFTLVVGSAGVAVSATASVSAAVEPPDAQQEVADGRYRETEHVRDYYRTAKL